LQKKIGPDRLGIRIENGDKNTIQKNYVMGSGTTDALSQRGIYGLHACRSVVNCNTVDNTTYGLNFPGACTGKKAISVITNNINNHRDGLLLGIPSSNSNAAIGQQVHTGNRWLGSYSDAGARHLGGFDPSQVSLFKVDNTANTNYMPDIVFPQFWFTDENANGNTVVCVPEYIIASGQNELLDDERIARGDVKGDADDGLMQWLTQRRLYERLTEEGNPNNNSSDIANVVTGAYNPDFHTTNYT
jgi:hypothetical protein